MAYTFAIDYRTNDLVIGKDGKLLTITGAQEVRQRILITLQHYWEEYFLNVQAGVPWYQVILGSKDINTAVIILRSVVLSVPGVISILGLNILRSGNSNRNWSVYVQAEVEGLAGPNIVDVVASIVQA